MDYIGTYETRPDDNNGHHTVLVTKDLITIDNTHKIPVDPKDFIISWRTISYTPTNGEKTQISLSTNIDYQNSGKITALSISSYDGSINCLVERK